MRQLRSDVSHRMRRRRPSIFAARWFRLLLGGGLGVVVGLTLGPPVAGWLRGNPPMPPVVLEPEPAPAPGQSSPVAPVLTPAEQPAGEGAATGAPQGQPAAGGRPGPGAVRAAASGQVGEHSGPVFRVQVGAFMDHRNADRLVERLRGENLEVVDRVVEQSRLLFRVVALPREGEAYERLAERVRQLGFTPELVGEGVAVTAPVPLRSAVEVSRRLRELKIAVRLERTVSAATFRVVRVGTFETAEEAERGRAELSARGFEGFVIREP